MRPGTWPARPAVNEGSTQASCPWTPRAVDTCRRSSWDTLRKGPCRTRRPRTTDTHSPQGLPPGAANGLHGTNPRPRISIPLPLLPSPRWGRFLVPSCSGGCSCSLLSWCRKDAHPLVSRFQIPVRLQAPAPRHLTSRFSRSPFTCNRNTNINGSRSQCLPQPGPPRGGSQNMLTMTTNGIRVTPPGPLLNPF